MHMSCCACLFLNAQNSNNMTQDTFTWNVCSLIVLYTHSDCRMTRTSCLLYLYTHSDCRMTRTSYLLYLYTHSDCRMTRTSCLLYLCTHSDCRMTRTSCLLYLCTHSDCRMTRTSCLLHLYTHICPALIYFFFFLSSNLYRVLTRAKRLEMCMLPRQHLYCYPLIFCCCIV